MKIVLDTNVFISCIGKKSSYCNVFDAYLRKEYTLCVSVEILLEYEEKLTAFWGNEVTENLMGRLLAGTNTSLHRIYYNFGLVSNDRLTTSLPILTSPPMPIILLATIRNFCT